MKIQFVWYGGKISARSVAKELNGDDEYFVPRRWTGFSRRKHCWANGSNGRFRHVVQTELANFSLRAINRLRNDVERYLPSEVEVDIRLDSLTPLEFAIRAARKIEKLEK